MSNTKGKGGTTQKFTEIREIQEDIVMLEGGYACLVLEIQATNFSLLSAQEQEARIFAYASLLNSLSFPIQIIIRNKQIDISGYITFLEQESQKAAMTPTTKGAQASAISTYIRLYKEFVQELVKVNTVLDKKFYVVISYSLLEKGPTGTTGSKSSDFFTSAKASLHTKTDALLGQLSRLSLKAKVLQKEELIKLFYDMYNSSHTTQQALGENLSPIVTSK